MCQALLLYKGILLYLREVYKHGNNIMKSVFWEEHHSNMVWDEEAERQTELYQSYDDKTSNSYSGI